MAEFTFFEVHLHDGALRAIANAPFSGRGGSDGTDDDAGGTGPDDDRGGLAPVVVVGLAVLALLVAWKLLDRDPADLAA